MEEEKSCEKRPKPISEAELWDYVYSSQNELFFRPIRGVLALPAPPERHLLPGSEEQERGDVDLANELGLLIAARPAEFEAEELDIGEYFNPTNLTANFVHNYIKEIRDIICGPSKRDRSETETRSVVKRLTELLPVAACTSYSIGLGVSALLIIVLLRATKGSLCKMATDDVIDSIIDPNRKFKKDSSGTWYNQDALEEASEPKIENGMMEHVGSNVFDFAIFILSVTVIVFTLFFLFLSSTS